MSAQKYHYDVTYKVLVLGESAVGKTALIRNYTTPDKQFNPSLLPTIGIDYRTEYMDVDGLRIRIQIWDTVGQERFRTMTKMFFRGAKGILLVYDITNRESFDKVTSWMSDLKEIIPSWMSDLKEGYDAFTVDHPAVAVELKHGLDKEEIFLIGNKIDLDHMREIDPEDGKRHGLDKEEIFLIGNKIDLDHMREIDPEDGKRISLKYGLKFYETSAKTGKNVKKAFEQLVYNMKDANDPYETGNKVGDEDWEQVFTNDLKVVTPTTDDRVNHNVSTGGGTGWCCSG